MNDRAKYIEKFQKLYELKNNKPISYELAFEYFEKLIVLVKAVHRKISKDSDKKSDISKL